MRILLTGHLGFIGKNLMPFLIKNGCHVDGFDLIEDENAFPNVSNYDWVIHLGANSNTTEKDLNKILIQNFDFSFKLYNQCLIHNVKFQYASSASVYGLESNFCENEFCKPLSPYAYSKYMFDNFLSLYGVGYQGFRYFNVYGKNEEKKGDQASPISKFYKQAKDTSEIKIFKNSNLYLRDFVSVDDICEMHLKFLKSPHLNGIWNLGTGKPISFLDVAKIIQNKINCKITEIPFPEDLKKQYQTFTCSNSNKLIKDIGDFKWKSVEEWVKINL